MKYLSSRINVTSFILDRRLTALGCQNGWVGVYYVDAQKNGLNFKLKKIKCNLL